MTTQSRRVVHITRGMPTEDGAGVKLTRLVGTPELPDLDPMLMLDTFRSDNPGDYIAGFPPHPHRGFETVSYMIHGRLQHRDNKGGEGLITDGGVQWMTAGRGVVHSEMPAQTDGAMFGFQLWLNLPARDKMMTPWYRDIRADEIPSVKLADGVSVKLIAGELGTAKGPGPERPTAPLIADITAGGAFALPIPDGHNAFLYVIDGKGVLGADKRSVTQGDLAILSDAGSLDGTADGNLRFLLVAGKPLREPVAKYGPFVMNTQNELRQAVNDYQRGLF
ncbi:MAG: pirin family protein [Alphaproteobacteria bacterium]|nr:pirin family protein [Alphaproteobacteria bacterium]